LGLHSDAIFKIQNLFDMALEEAVPEAVPIEKQYFPGGVQSYTVLTVRFEGSLQHPDMVNPMP
jgi:hypothetical protein